MTDAKFQEIKDRMINRAPCRVADLVLLLADVDQLRSQNQSLQELLDAAHRQLSQPAVPGSPMLRGELACFREAEPTWPIYMTQPEVDALQKYARLLLAHVDYLTGPISDALAIGEGLEQYRLGHQVGWEQGRNAGLEEAASLAVQPQMVGSHFGPVLGLADDIRALKR